MVFLIEYDRSKGEIVTFRKFGNNKGEAAEGSRLNMELDLHRRGVEHEVVLLEAENEEALRRTHRRYFEDLAQLVS
jgi:hypothetical protein